MVGYRTHPNKKVNDAALSATARTLVLCKRQCDAESTCVGFVLLYQGNLTYYCWHVLLAGEVIVVRGTSGETYYQKLVVCQGERPKCIAYNILYFFRGKRVENTVCNLELYYYHLDIFTLISG